MPEKPCCGGCAHFLYEDFCGVGWCEVHHTNPSCGDAIDCPDHKPDPESDPLNL